MCHKIKWENNQSLKWAWKTELWLFALLSLTIFCIKTEHSLYTVLHSRNQTCLVSWSGVFAVRWVWLVTELLVHLWHDAEWMNHTVIKQIHWVHPEHLLKNDEQHPATVQLVLGVPSLAEFLPSLAERKRLSWAVASMEGQFSTDTLAFLKNNFCFSS